MTKPLNHEPRNPFDLVRLLPRVASRQKQSTIFCSGIDQHHTRSHGPKHEHLATKTDLADLKIDLMSVINSQKNELKEDMASLRLEVNAQKNELKEDMSILRSDLNKSIYMVGLVQFLAIVGSLIGIFTFIFK